MVYKYNMPDKYKRKITKEFCEKFSHNLIETFSKNDKSLLEDKTNLSGILMFCDGTGGWNDALRKTCNETNNKELMDYYDCLPWYDSDLFDYEVEKMIYKYGICKAAY